MIRTNRPDLASTANSRTLAVMETRRRRRSRQRSGRIDAEETTLATAELFITSTHNEIEEQYGLYDYYLPERMRVIPPGTDLKRFHPPADDDPPPPFAEVVERFLDEPDKPLILALSRTASAFRWSRCWWSAARAPTRT